MRFPQHETLEILLKNNQFDACRVLAETMIAQLMTILGDDSESKSVAAALTQWQGRDMELACLHTYLSRALVGLDQHELAAQKADIAAFLAHKLQDMGMAEEALYRAGLAFGRHGDFRKAIARFTESLQSGSGVFRGEALYSRALCYYSQGAYSHAVPDYEAACSVLIEGQPQLARMCRLNLAWVLILTHQFDQAEGLISELAAEPGAENDPTLQLQLAHDRIHLSYLKGNHEPAIKQAVLALRAMGNGFPHIRAYISLTLMSMAIDNGLPQTAFSFGIATKRLAAQAKRPDLDDKVGKRLRALQYEYGTESLAESLRQIGQVPPGALSRRRPSKNGGQARGVV